MFKHHKRFARTFALVTFVVIFLSISSLLSRNFSFDAIAQFIKSQGRSGQILYVFYLLISTIIAPLTSLPLWPIALFSYGFWTAVFLTFLGNFFGGVANFYIARFFGREIIEKIAGKRFLKSIDEFAKDIKWRSFLVLRILGNISFDAISYAIGLTSFKGFIYISITLVTQFIWVLGGFYLLDRAISLGKIPSIIMIGLVYVLAIYGGIELWHRHRHNHK